MTKVEIKGNGYSETKHLFNLLEVQARVSEKDEEVIRLDERTKTLDEVYGLITDFLIMNNTELDFNLALQNKILDLKYGKSK